MPNHRPIRWRAHLSRRATELASAGYDGLLIFGMPLNLIGVPQLPWIEGRDSACIKIEVRDSSCIKIEVRDSLCVKIEGIVRVLR